MPADALAQDRTRRRRRRCRTRRCGPRCPRSPACCSVSPTAHTCGSVNVTRGTRVATDLVARVLAEDDVGRDARLVLADVREQRPAVAVADRVQPVAVDPGRRAAGRRPRRARPASRPTRRSPRSSVADGGPTRDQDLVGRDGRAVGERRGHRAVRPVAGDARHRGAGDHGDAVAPRSAARTWSPANGSSRASSRSPPSSRVTSRSRAGGTPAPSRRRPRRRRARAGGRGRASVAVRVAVVPRRARRAGRGSAGTAAACRWRGRPRVPRVSRRTEPSLAVTSTARSPGQPRVAAHERDVAVASATAADPVSSQPLDDLVAPGRARPPRRSRPVTAAAAPGDASRRGQHVAGPQQRLAGDAGPVRALAADQLGLDDRRRQTALGAPVLPRSRRPDPAPTTTTSYESCVMPCGSWAARASPVSK